MTGQQLRALRRKAGKTQEQLAAILAVAPNTVARWERGERAISAPMALLIRAMVKR